jgi:anti-sigma-K factor RskA
MSTERTHEQLEEMAVAFVLGVLEEPERSELLAHIEAGCDLCTTLYPQLAGLVAHLPLAVEPVPPPAGLRDRILTAAGVTGSAGSESRDRRVVQPEFRPRRGGWVPALALAAGVAAVFFLVRMVQLNNDLVRARTEAVARAADVERLTRELDGVKATVAQQTALLDLLEQPGSGLVTLASLAPAPEATGKVLWDAVRGRGYLWVRRLPIDPEGKDYQLWAIVDGAPVSAGVFSVSTDGEALVPLLDIGANPAVSAFAITLEPAGGVPAPTGDMVLLGPTGG